MENIFPILRLLPRDAESKTKMGQLQSHLSGAFFENNCVHDSLPNQCSTEAFATICHVTPETNKGIVKSMYLWNDDPNANASSTFGDKRPKAVEHLLSGINPSLRFSWTEASPPTSFKFVLCRVVVHFEKLIVSPTSKLNVPSQSRIVSI